MKGAGLEKGDEQDWECAEEEAVTGPNEVHKEGAEAGMNELHMAAASQKRCELRDCVTVERLVPLPPTGAGSTMRSRGMIDRSM